MKKILGQDSNLNSESKSEPEKKRFPSSNCKEKEQLTAKSIHQEKIMNHEITEVVDETLEELDNQSELVVGNKIEAMNTDLSNSEVANHFGRAKKSKLKCKVCGKNFSTAPVVKRHISSVHEGKKPFSCDKCSKCFAFKDELRKHRESVHEEKTYSDKGNHFGRAKKSKFNCKVCGNDFSCASVVKRHISSVQEKKAKECCRCSKTFLNKKRLNLHFKKVHVLNKKNCDNKKVFVKAKKDCPQCSEQFLNKSLLLEHIQKVHGGKMPFMCKENFCKAAFFSDSKLKKHSLSCPKRKKVNENRNEKLEKEKCEKQNRERKTTDDNKNPKSNKCYLCDKGFSNPGNLQKHVDRVHLKRKPFQCSTCQDNFFSFENLLKHSSKKHAEDDLPTKCSLCNYTTTISIQLMQHIETHDQEIKKFQCDQCKLSFEAKPNLKKHVEAVHLKLKPHKCIKCDFSASRGTNLKRHMKSKHPE